MSNPLNHEDLQELNKHYDGINYHYKHELRLDDLLLTKGGFSQEMQAKIIGQNFSKLVGLIAKRGDSLVGMTVSIYVDDQFYTRTISLLIRTWDGQ